MTKLTAAIGFLTLAFALNANAQDNKTDQIERDIQDIKLRLSKLESMMGSPNKAQEFAPSGDGWKSISNWRKLAAGMAPADVERLLGEPQQLDGGIVAYWTYKNDGRVVFVSGKVQSWTEPKR